MMLLNLRVSYLVAKRESDDFDMMMKLLVMMIRKITQWYVTSALPFVPKQFISKFFLGFFFALDRCQLLLGFGSVLIGSLGSDDKFCK
ncbi:unnamed protein product [Rhizophagus irregularis]|nr:unnamed protein product [Rhizophagus irregularis]